MVLITSEVVTKLLVCWTIFTCGFYSSDESASQTYWNPWGAAMGQYAVIREAVSTNIDDKRENIWDSAEWSSAYCHCSMFFGHHQPLNVQYLSLVMNTEKYSTLLLVLCRQKTWNNESYFGPNLLNVAPFPPRGIRLSTANQSVDGESFYPWPQKTSSNA